MSPELAVIYQCDKCPTYYVSAVAAQSYPPRLFRCEACVELHGKLTLK
jgi:hypothetical protein